MSEPHDPHSEHPHDEEFPFEFHAEHEGTPGDHLEGHHEAGDPAHPLDELGISASTDEFHFTGPAEELDFTEPSDFSFPTEHPAEGEAVSESSAELIGAEHAATEHLYGGEETAEHAIHEGGASEELAAEVDADGAVPDLDISSEEEAKPKRKRELPAWVHTLQWAMVGLLGAGSLIAIIVAIGWIQDADTVSLVLNVCCPLMLLLIPFAMWRSASRWTKPAVRALYTIMIVVSVAALIGGTWMEGVELSRYKWQFNKARVQAGKPRSTYVAPQAK